jgi:hypothetical protein
MRQQTSFAITDSTNGVQLTIDYGNGAQKKFAAIDWTEGMGILDVLKAAGSINPGVKFIFQVTLASDRGGRQRGFIASIDGVEGNQANAEWQIWINDNLATAEVATKSQLMSGTPEIKTGDALALRLLDRVDVP